MFRSRWTTLGVLAAALLGGCGPDERNPGGGPDGGGGGNGDGGGNQDGCSDAAKLVYVVDENTQLSTFDPATKMFHDLGQLDCPADALSGPFSMGIDREANAWVLYDSGELFKVNTSNLSCTATSWTTQANLALFGMGFSTDAVGGSVDTLFVAGGLGLGTSTTSTLATLNIAGMPITAATKGTVQGNPELTGTGNAELWGFFPDAAGSRIAKIDKTNGALTPHSLPASLAGQPRAWAFAFWGGDFWIFLRKDTEASTTVYQVDATGQLKGQTAAGGRTIVGAGVSTCAPTVIL